MQSVTNMIRWLVVCLFWGMVIHVCAEDVTINGKVYKNVRWGTYTDTSVTMIYSGGTLEVPYQQLPPELQRRFHFTNPTSSPSANKAAASTTSNKGAKTNPGDVIELHFNWVDDCQPAGNGLYTAKLWTKDQSSTLVEYDESGKESMERWSKEADAWQRYINEHNNWRIVRTRESYDYDGNKIITRLPEPRPPRSGDRLVYAKVQEVEPRSGKPSMLLVGSAQFVGMTGKISYKW